MPTLQIRLTDEASELVRKRGGSPWAREVLLQKLKEKKPVGAERATSAALLAWLES